ncbi:MAG: dCTP deaminase [Verrucomicrobia bacterium]|nr:dCTP deaminase [Verrucomicrobiota bacterium]
MSVLNKQALQELIEQAEYGRKLIVTPLLSPNQIGPASIDVRLGSSIIVPRRTFVASHDVTDPRRVEQVEKRLYDRVRLRYHSEFILHPNQLILAATLEYISLPKSVFCQVASRSSWGRLGLVVATASVVQPGFKGCLTLELANLSDSPIALYPGLLIGQLVFYDVKTTGEAIASAYEGRYDCPTEAGLPQFFTKRLDDEMIFWGHSGNSPTTKP